MNAQVSCDTTLSAAVYDALAAHDPESAQRFAQAYGEPTEAAVGHQIAHMNRFWRDQLGEAPVSTIKARECLIDHCELDDWLRLFKTQVVPAICRLQLPQPLSS